MDQTIEMIAQSDSGHLIAYGQLLNQGKTQRTTITFNGAPLTWYQAIELWHQEVEFRSLITQVLRDSPYSAFFWETPPLTPASLHQPWEFVVVNAPSLAKVSPNPQPFAQYLERGDDPIQVFANLGGDAMLISPRALGPLPTYTHLANFLRQGPPEQVDAMWQMLGHTLQKLMGDALNIRTAPLWVSTSGLGVYWLHLRLDDFPKYYTHRPYRTA
ncbi:DUF6940 family protein [Acaryochloris sp. CCMEE 5410]|uniref:DUF6940 family protein n=1 Tax=Acaryochloris sp. CCMEE 5410 TaxID=310037 RepID=UPI000248531C|nr:hypothetical protein [Acaryochloris sp. CCMEE 5410]KAI9133757.1 hypothetical protein ON05_010945 [Acaryochloris sp. CCMEE 5410]